MDMPKSVSTGVFRHFTGPQSPGTVDVPGRAASTSVIDPTMRTPSAATKPRETLTACWPGCGT